MYSRKTNSQSETQEENGVTGLWLSLKQPYVKLVGSKKSGAWIQTWQGAKGEMREGTGRGGGGGVYSQGPSATRFSQGIGQKNMLSKHKLWPIKNSGELANWTIRVPHS